MREIVRNFGAGLLTLAVIGGTGAYLTNSLFAAQPKSTTEVTSVQTNAHAVEVVTVVGNRRAS